jgi:uncharacterized membrane protein HdeD (DUF308 family)
MSLTTLALAVFLILYGISALGWVAVSATVIGVVALVAGILILVDGYHPVTVFRRGPQA